jgi:predicted DNA-binding transcriptional regulator YafY
MTYHSFHREEPSTFEVEPYCVKLFEQRWYMLGKSEKYPEPRIYSLDRIKALEPTEHKFKLPKKFDAEKFFADYYGIIISDDDYDVCPVALEVNAQQSNYLRTLPLHHTQVEVEPYCVKLFEQRWYMLGMSDKLRIYALDRIKALEPTERKFKLPKKFDAVKFFEDYYGIIIGDKDFDVEPVALMVDSWQSKYLRTLPLHHSQVEVERNEEYSIFEYRLCPSFDFQQKLLSMGDSVGVLAPVLLKDMLRTKAEKTANNNASAGMGSLYHFKVYKK